MTVGANDAAVTAFNRFGFGARPVAFALAASNVSMMRMRPPKQGQILEAASVAASSVAVVAPLVSISGRGREVALEATIRSRRRPTVAARPELARKP